MFHATLDVDTFDVMIPLGGGSGDKINGNADGSGVRDSASGSTGLSSVKVGVFGVCTQHTPSLADPGDKVMIDASLSVVDT